MNELSAGSYDPPEAFPKPCLPEPRQHLTRQEQQPAPWSLMAPWRPLFLFEPSGARPWYHFPLWAVAREPLKKIMLPPPVWITGSRCLILENAKASLPSFRCFLKSMLQPLFPLQMKGVWDGNHRSMNQCTWKRWMKHFGMNIHPKRVSDQFNHS